MYYELIPQNGDTLAVPLLVFSNLPRADENCIRVALYVLQTGCTDSAVIARELGLRSVHAAERALQWWAGAGLLKAHRGHSPEPAVLPAAEPEPDLSLVLCDPRIALIMEQAQSCLGGALSSQESRNLASLYTTEGYAADVILLCLSHLTGQPGVNLNAVRSELKRWKKAGVRSGEDVERLLALEERRAEHEAFVATLLGKGGSALTPSERRSVQRWYEKYGFNDEMVQNAVQYLGAERTVWAMNDILKGWHEKGWRTPQDLRGGIVFGRNIRVDSAPAVPAAPTAPRSPTRKLRLKREDR